MNNLSWDKYNEARKKAKEAQNKLEKASKTADKLTGKSSDKLTKSEINQAKTAVKNAKSNKWLAGIFIVITIVMLCTLPFSEYFESKINSTFERDGVITAITDAREHSTLNINYINVLQGDCILINLPDGKNMIIDAGTILDYHNRSDYPEASDDNVVSSIRSYLVDSGNPKIDYMIMTHPDYDHFSFMEAILENFEVVEMYRPNVYFGIEDESSASAEDLAFAEEERERAEAIDAAYVTEEMYQEDRDTYNGFNVKTQSVASYGDTLMAMYAEAEQNGGDSKVGFTFELDTITNANDPNVDPSDVYTFTFYAPIDSQHLYTDMNNYSAFIILEFNDITYCFTGDTEAELEEQIIDLYGDELPDVDIMDAGHHGSRTSSSSALLDILKPEVVICSCDNGDAYDHPADETVQRFLDAGVAKNCFFTTNNNGNICVALDYTPENTGEGTAGDTGSIDTASQTAPNTTSNESTVGDTTDESVAGSENTPESDVTEVSTPEFAYVVGITKNGEITVTEMRWWYIVVGVIVVSAVLLLVIAPSIIKAVKKGKSK